jgi:YD repeat-containing protein
VPILAQTRIIQAEPALRARSDLVTMSKIVQRCLTWAVVEKAHGPTPPQPTPPPAAAPAPVVVSNKPETVSWVLGPNPYRYTPPAAAPTYVAYDANGNRTASTDQLKRTRL